MARSVKQGVAGSKADGMTQAEFYKLFETARTDLAAIRTALSSVQGDMNNIQIVVNNLCPGGNNLAVQVNNLRNDLVKVNCNLAGVNNAVSITATAPVVNFNQITLVAGAPSALNLTA